MDGELARSNTTLDDEAIDHLYRLMASWGLLADLCFADLLLFAAARALLDRARVRRVRVRFLELRCFDFVRGPQQLALFGPQEFDGAGPAGPGEGCDPAHAHGRRIGAAETLAETLDRIRTGTMWRRAAFKGGSTVRRSSRWTGGTSTPRARKPMRSRMDRTRMDTSSGSRFVRRVVSRKWLIS